MIQASKLKYYHPCDSLNDGSVTWLTGLFNWTGVEQFTAGKIGNAFQYLSGNYAVMASPADQYGGGWGHVATPTTSITRATTAAWIMLGTGEAMSCGFGYTPNVFSGFQIHQNGNLIFFNGGVSDPLGAVLTIPDTGWHFHVIDLEWDGADYAVRHSLDGAAWSSVGTVTLPPPLTYNQGGGANARGMIWTGYQAASSKFDEVATWVDAELFTSAELQNLYDLGMTFGSGLDQYEENYGAPICWQATASMPDGTIWRDSGSGPCPSVMRVPQGASDIIVTDNGKRVAPRIQEG